MMGMTSCSVASSVSSAAFTEDTPRVSIHERMEATCSSLRCALPGGILRFAHHLKMPAFVGLAGHDHRTGFAVLQRTVHAAEVHLLDARAGAMAADAICLENGLYIGVEGGGFLANRRRSAGAS